MNASRFTELLNLYIDQELSASEASELEAEIARNPERRRTYEQYCRMQRACTLLFESARAQAPAHAKLALAARAADEKVLLFPAAAGRRSVFQNRGLWGACLGAAAACIATVLVLRQPAADIGPLEGNPGMAQTASATANPAPTDPRIGAILPAAGSQAAPVGLHRPSDYQLAVFFNRQSQDAAAAFTHLESSDLALDWMNRMELSTLPHVSLDSLRFHRERPAGERPTTILSRPASLRLDEEFNAFEFRR